MASDDKRRQRPTPAIPSTSEATEIEATGLATGEDELVADHVYLILTHGADRQVIEVVEDGVLVFGRDEDCDVVIEASKISRRHFSTTRSGSFMLLRDLDSTNGTKLNGVTLRGTERRLVGGDVIGVGKISLTVAAASGSAIAATHATSRLELELARIAEANGSATLLRIDLPPNVQSAALEQLARLLNRVAVVEQREEGQYAALLEGADQAATNKVQSEVRRLIPNTELATARYPADGSSLSELWPSARQTETVGAVPEVDLAELPQGVCVADPAMMKVFRVARRVARTDTTVLVLGETGSGKEVVAEQIHRYSSRAEKPYVRLNCASLPETLLSSELFGHEKGAFTGADRRKVGYFEAADGGTLLLDEIGELSLSMQVKLLRVLENRTVLRLGATSEIPVDVRVICATHRDLQKDIASQRFREDLFYRVSAFSLTVPPLRDRPTEVGLLTELFVRQHAERMGTPPPTISDAALAALTSHRWPGNVRELRNAIEHAFVMCDDAVILPEHLPESTRTPDDQPASQMSSGGVKDKLAQIERASIIKALADENGNQTRAAKRLGMSRRALIYKMGKYEIKRQPRN
jgi:two-component system response regulator AtoC